MGPILISSARLRLIDEDAVSDKVAYYCQSDVRARPDHLIVGCGVKRSSERLGADEAENWGIAHGVSALLGSLWIAM